MHIEKYTQHRCTMIFFAKRTQLYIQHPIQEKSALPKGNKIIVSERCLHLHVDCSITWNSQDKQSKCPSIDEWIKKM